MGVYKGSCHCGAVRYEAEIDLSEPATVCNCSICQRTGTMLLFIPAEDFTLQEGDSVLSDYQFNKKVLHHLFCSNCGVRSFIRGSDGKGNEMIAINARCLEDVELGDIEIQHYDGKSV